MTLTAPPKDVAEFLQRDWPQIEPQYAELAARRLNGENVEGWLAEWSRLCDLVNEAYSRLYVATSINTADEAAARAFSTFLDTIYPAARAADQQLRQKLLESGLHVEGFEVPLRNMRAEADLFRQENLPLLTEEEKLSTEYDKIIGAQTVMWEGKEITVTQLAPVYLNPDRAVRERAWRLAAERQLADREAIIRLWQKSLQLRRSLAANAGFDNYLQYRWKQLLRFDYTLEDAKRFHNAIEQVVMPAAARIYERGRKRLGVDALRPWDLTLPQGFGRVVDPPDTPPLHPFQDVSELEARCATMFERVDPQLGRYFQIMRQEGLLDLENRKNKAPGAYSIPFEASGRPFIFANAVGLHADVQTVLHEGGHAFHVFETRHLPFFQQRAESAVPTEFAEVASMGMELLASPYLAAEQGGFYTPPQAARALKELLEQSILFWPYMAVVDAFQHWAYQNVEAAMDPTNCDAEWQRLWGCYMIGVDWSGLEDVSAARWLRQSHIHTTPLYYVEYGLAQLGAVQVWRNALSDQSGAVARYRHALSLGGTVSLPQLFAAAGARLAFDAATLGEAVALMENKIEELEALAERE